MNHIKPKNQINISFIGWGSHYYSNTLDQMNDTHIMFTSFEKSDILVVGSSKYLSEKDKERFDQILADFTFGNPHKIISDDMFADLLRERYPEEFL